MNLHECPGAVRSTQKTTAPERPPRGVPYSRHTLSDNIAIWRLTVAPGLAWARPTLQPPCNMHGNNLESLRLIKGFPWLALVNCVGSLLLVMIGQLEWPFLSHAMI
jgi:hypothetical protein